MRGGVATPALTDRIEKRPGQTSSAGVKADIQRLSAASSRGRSDNPNDSRLRNSGGKCPATTVGNSTRSGTSRSSRPRANSAHPQIFFGLPGNPISTACSFLLFAAPILAALTGSRETHPRFVLAQLACDTDRKTKAGLTRFLPALCTFYPSVKALPQVATVPWQGSGDLTAFAQSNCFLVIPEEIAHFEAGSTVRILLH